jgi:hypothetical protein
MLPALLTIGVIVLGIAYAWDGDVSF